LKWRRREGGRRKERREEKEQERKRREEGEIKKLGFSVKIIIGFWFNFFFLGFVWSIYECMNIIDEDEEEEDEEKEIIRCWWYTIKYNGHAIKWLKLNKKI